MDLKSTLPLKDLVQVYLQFLVHIYFHISLFIREISNLQAPIIHGI